MSIKLIINTQRINYKCLLANDHQEKISKQKLSLLFAANRKTEHVEEMRDVSEGIREE